MMVSMQWWQPFSETNLTIGTDNSSLQSEEDDELEELG